MEFPIFAYFSFPACMLRGEEKLEKTKVQTTREKQRNTSKLCVHIVQRKEKKFSHRVHLTFSRKIEKKYDIFESTVTIVTLHVGRRFSDAQF